MAFPTGPVDNGTLYTDEYGNVFKYDDITGSWEKYLGNEFGEPVLTSGATMFGDLIQTPSSSVRPQEPGELSVNRVDDTKIQFRYMGLDFASHGFDMDMDCVEDVTQDLIITSDAVTEDSVFAQFGDVLQTLQDGEIVGGDQSARTFMWERSDQIGDAGLYVDTGVTTETYTVLESDRGKYLRRKDTWTGTGTCGGTFVQRSNPLPVVFQLPTPVAYMAFTKKGGPGSLELTLSGPSIVYEIKSDGAWESVENFSAGQRTLSFNNSETKTYAFESEDMTHFKWVAGDDNFDFEIDSRSLTPSLNTLYQSFSNQPKYNQNVNFLQTANVSNMAQAFSNAESFNGNVSFNVSNVTNARSAFQGCTSLTKNFTWNMPKLQDASSMFLGCENITNVRILPGNQITNTSRMFENCSKFNGQIHLLNSYNLTNAAKMLKNCRAYTARQDNVRNWKFSNLTNAHALFSGCRVFNANISDQAPAFLDMPKLTNASYMFSGCLEFNQWLLQDWRWVSCTNYSYMFSGCSKLRCGVQNMMGGAATDLSGMFEGCYEISGLGTWSPYLGNVESMRGMFTRYQQSRLYGISEWNTSDLNANGLDYFFYLSDAYEEMINWRVRNITSRPTEFSNSPKMNANTTPKWGSFPPTFAWTSGAGTNNIGEIRNETHPDRVSGQGQPGDVVYPFFNVTGGDVTTYEWRLGGGVHPNNPGTREYTVTAADRGKDLKCKVTATAPDGSTATVIIGRYTIAGSSRSQSATSYSVTTVDTEQGESAVVKLQFTGVDPVEYFKMDGDGEFVLVGEMQPGSPKVLTLPEGVYTWEAANMTVLDYSDSPEEVQIIEHSTAYNPTV